MGRPYGRAPRFVRSLSRRPRRCTGLRTALVWPSPPPPQSTTPEYHAHGRVTPYCSALPATRAPTGLPTRARVGSLEAAAWGSGSTARPHAAVGCGRERPPTSEDHPPCHKEKHSVGGPAWTRRGGGLRAGARMPRSGTALRPGRSFAMRRAVSRDSHASRDTHRATACCRLLAATGISAEHAQCFFFLLSGPVATPCHGPFPGPACRTRRASAPVSRSLAPARLSPRLDPARYRSTLSTHAPLWTSRRQQPPRAATPPPIRGVGRETPCRIATRRGCRRLWYLAPHPPTPLMMIPTCWRPSAPRQASGRHRARP